MILYHTIIIWYYIVDSDSPTMTVTKSEKNGNVLVKAFILFIIFIPKISMPKIVTMSN